MDVAILKTLLALLITSLIYREIGAMLGMADYERIRAVVALSYPNLDSPANAFRSPRHKLETFVRWVGFD